MYFLQINIFPLKILQQNAFSGGFYETNPIRRENPLSDTYTVSCMSFLSWFDGIGILPWKYIFSSELAFWLLCTIYELQCVLSHSLYWTVLTVWGALRVTGSHTQWGLLWPLSVWWHCRVKLTWSWVTKYLYYITNPDKECLVMSIFSVCDWLSLSWVTRVFYSPRLT